MAKGQKRSGREPKKPKRTKTKPILTSPPVGSLPAKAKGTGR